jgi:hypothetical protein
MVEILIVAALVLWSAVVVFKSLSQDFWRSFSKTLQFLY